MDNSLSAPSGTQRGPARAGDVRLDLALSSSGTLWECLQRCWQDDVYIDAISDKFLRLTLQLLSRSVLFFSVTVPFILCHNMSLNVVQILIVVGAVLPVHLYFCTITLNFVDALVYTSVKSAL